MGEAMLIRIRQYLRVFLLLSLGMGIALGASGATVAAKIPNRMVYAIKFISEKEVWVGTEDGAARYDGTNWTVYRTEDGLPQNVVTSIAVDPTDGSMWFGTFGGIAHWRNGKFESYSTKNSGLINDVVYGVSVNSPYVWVATTDGISRFQPATREWKTFNDTNAPMHEIWVYGVDTEPTTKDTWFAIWGSGLLLVKPNGEFVSYPDPDEIFDVDLVRNDGPLHEIQVSVSVKGNVVYSGAYFGLTRYDGKNWNTWTVKDADSGLPSDFINVVKMSPNGKVVALGTDKGLCLFDFDQGKWTTYRRNRNGPGGELVTFQNGAWKTEVIPQAPAGDFIWSIEFQGDTIWVGTSTGLYTAQITM